MQSSRSFLIRRRPLWRELWGVGGANGSLVEALVQSNPSLRGVVLDLPPVAEDAQAAIEAAHLQDRVTFAAGDFLKSVPAGDLYLLRHILHDWPDEECI